MSSRNAPEILELDTEQTEALLCRLEARELTPDDFEALRAALQSYLYVTQLIDSKSTTIARLRKLLFGVETEKTAAVTGREPTSGTQVEPATTSAAASSSEAAKKSKGHGRNGADDYPGAERVSVAHESLQPGDPCRACERGTVYAQAQPGIELRFAGQPPIQVTIYELEKLRCHLCGRIFTAQAPAAAGADKYDPSVASMIGLPNTATGSLSTVWMDCKRTWEFRCPPRRNGTSWPGRTRSFSRRATS